MNKGKKTIRLTESEMVEMIERIVNEVKREKRNQISESRRRYNRKYISKLNEQVTKEINVKKTMPSETATLSKLFAMSYKNGDDQVTGIIGSYYLASDNMWDGGYSGKVFAFDSLKFGGSSGREEVVPVMTLPVPISTGRFRWDALIGNSPGFDHIMFDQITGKNMSDQNETEQSVAKDINAFYNEIPLRDLWTIYNNDKNKASYDELIANFKTTDSQRNKQILPLLTGNAKDFFA